MRGGFGNKEGGEMAIGVGRACHHANQRVRGEDIRVVVWRDRGVVEWVGVPEASRMGVFRGIDSRVIIWEAWG